MKNQKAPRVLRETSPARIFARPTADDLWLGPTQESALRQLCAALPLKVLLGPPSSGRTSLLRYLASRQRRDLVVLASQGAHRHRATVLKSLLASAGLSAAGLALNELRDLLTVFMREQQARGRRVVIQIDDAEGLGAAALNEVLRSIEAAGQGLPGPELILGLEHIDHASSPAADFIRSCEAPAVIVLSWLNPTEVGWYLHWRMRRFGLGDTFTGAATRLIAQCTRGCYAAVDSIGQMSLLLLRNRDIEHVDVLLVREAIKALQRQRARRSAGAGFGIDAELIVTRDGVMLHQGSIGERFLIGRSRLNDLALDCPHLSRHHLAFARGATGYYLSDLNSMNGVLLNGQKVGSAPVGNGDLIEVGPYRIKLVVPNEQAGAGPARPLDELAETSVMPAPENPEPAYLKLIK